MWRGAGDGTFPGVDAVGQPRKLALEVRFDAQPIRGRVYDREDGARLDRRFSGWLGLMSAIEEARTGYAGSHTEGEGR